MKKLNPNFIMKELYVRDINGYVLTFAESI